MKKYTPNTTLPNGAKKVRSFTTTVGSWSSLTVDAVLTWRGIKWYRVKGGFGGGNDREDWVAALPYGCVAVSDYHWRGRPFGLHRYRSFPEAIEGNIRHGVANLIQEKRRLLSKLSSVRSSMSTIRKALRK